MQTLINRGFDLLNRKVVPAAILCVAYFRGNVCISRNLPGTLSRTDIEQFTDGQLTAVDRQARWRFKKDMLTIDGQQTLPKHGDVIEWKWCRQTFRFEVLPSQGEVAGDAVDQRSDWTPATAKLIEIRND